MQAVIAQYYKTQEKAVKRAKALQRMWRGKIAWYIVSAKNGYFVISETQARLCYPQLKFSYKNRKYK